MENSHMEVSCIWAAKTQKPTESLDQKYWKKIFISSCLCAVLLDPLFLYVPILKDDIKCLMLDPKLKIVILLLRSLTDFFYLMDIIIRIYRSENYSSLINELNHRQHQLNFNFVLKSCVPRIAKTIWTSYDILIDIVALLPLPQVAILIFFSEMSDLRSLTTTRMVLMNVFTLLQYVPRVLRIYLSFKELKKRPLNDEIRETPIWIKGLLNFSMYIIASHVAGALWYFFAIQRMMICWHSACRKNDGCDNRMFGCHDHHFFRNTTILNDLCPVSVGDNSSDTMFFDFGIFATVLKYGIVGSTSYFKKFLNCFWWGLRNLSSFGSNLEPSADGWENLYTVFISISGLLLFLYLIGNLQMYMQFETTRREDHKRMMLHKQKMEEKGRDIELWLFKRGVPTRLNKDMKLRIIEKVQQALEDGMDINLDNILPLLPSDVQSRIEDYMPLTKLKQVPMLRGIDEHVLKTIWQKFEPVRYTESENSFIIQKDEPLDKMVYIVDGFVYIKEGSSSRRGEGAGAGELCGEELLRWPFSSFFHLRNPLATESVMATGVVEALALKASDLQSIYMQSDILEKEERRHRRMMKEEFKLNIDGLIQKNDIFQRLNEDVKLRIMESVELKIHDDGLYWDLLNGDQLVSYLPEDFQDQIERYLPVTKLAKVPMLRGIDEDVLKIICQKLKPVRYTKNSFIIQKGEQLDKMVYIVDGFVSIEERSSDDSRRGAGELFGEELLRLPFSTDFPFTRPLATESVKAIDVVEAIALYAQDLRSIYRKLDTFEKEKPRHRRMMKEEIERNIDGLIRRNGIPEKLNQDVKLRTMKNVEENFQQVDLYWDLLDWDHLVSGLPLDFQKEIISYMPLTKLKQVLAFQNMDYKVLKEICNHLQPMKYNRTDNIIEKGDPIQMLLIVEGRIGQEGWVKNAGEIYGDELLVWPFSTSFPNKVPAAAKSPSVITDVVEALVLTASDMESVATKFRKHFIKNYGKFVRKSEFDLSTDYYSEGAIKEATRNYTCLNNPNEEGFGTVYHTELDGRVVAIKMCNSAAGDPFIQSQRLVHEAFVLLHISHKNVERLLGCCLETRWPVMVYDRTDALTLVEHFHRNKSKLSLESRTKIAAETAGALAHVHSRSVIHRDVKTTNILIDRTTHTVKVTGFGASRLLDEDEGEMEDEVSTLPGTSRHLDPEYLKSHDVYSFGVVLVELLTRQETISSDGSETSLANDFVCSVQEDRLGQILDGEINTDKFSFEKAKKVSELAVTCLRSRGEERPSMEKVAEGLEGLVQTIRNRVEHSTVDDNVSTASRTSE
ncbi:uncharacterized protein LOC103936744 isoform X3 [Pyrus x bretschneideri]|uniref:uncharacterized protein LOC103936744 isoform X3 n=1 Tax=Pyrus x bretschneideri TaxID=225117 RepID=UPI00202F4E07|nr:uncharacterized protein LOC103936744 isoform X3 [Pyrus x bretschneideri]